METLSSRRESFEREFNRKKKQDIGILEKKF